jgi:hypothetical protein
MRFSAPWQTRVVVRRNRSGIGLRIAGIGFQICIATNWSSRLTTADGNRPIVPHVAFDAYPPDCAPRGIEIRAVQCGSTVKPLSRVATTIIMV